MKRANVPILILALVTLAVWGLVIRQEMERSVLNPSKGRQPAEQPTGLPTRVVITLPAPGSGPTEETPVVEIIAQITHAETGEPVFAEVRAGPVSAPDTVSLSHVAEFRLVFPAGDEAISITVTAPGYQKWSVDIKPHIKRSKIIHAPIKLQAKPTRDSA